MACCLALWCTRWAESAAVWLQNELQQVLSWRLQYGVLQRVKFLTCELSVL
jgi:hypothetical protein